MASLSRRRCNSTARHGLLEVVNGGKNFFVLGKAKRFELGEDTLAIEDHFKGPTMSFD